MATSLFSNLTNSVSTGISNTGAYISGNDSVSILLFGLLYLLFGYGSVFGFYVKGLKKINEGRTTMSAVMLKAFVLQVSSILFIWVILLTLNIFSRFSSSSGLNFAEATLLFFKVNWLNVDMNTIIQNVTSSGQPLASIGIYLIIQAIWIVLTVVFVILPLGLVIGLAYSEIKKHAEQASNYSQTSLITTISTSLILIIVIFAIHFTLPAVFLKGLQTDNPEYANYTSGLPTLDGYGYQSRAKDFIENSINIDGN